MGKARQTVVHVAGRDVVITNPDKTFFPEAGHTKLDLVRYYAAIAEGALRGIAGRPIVGTTLTRAIGTWNGSKPLSFLYRWDRCLDRACGVRAVAARTRTYRVRPADRGRRLRLTVVATNAVGRATASSTPTRTIR